jgi:hypothetical protein
LLQHNCTHSVNGTFPKVEIVNISAKIQHEESEEKVETKLLKTKRTEGLVLVPTQQAAFVFEVSKNDVKKLRKAFLSTSIGDFPTANLLGKINFDIIFHLNLPFSKTSYSCSISTDFYDFAKPQCLVESSLPAEANVGSFAPYECKISLQKNVQETAQVWLSVEVDRRFWLIHGLKKSCCVLSPGESKNFQFKLLPLIAGMLPGPLLRLSVDEQAAVEIPSEKTVYVSPPKVFSSSLREKQ